MKKLFSFIMVALMVGAFTSCKNAGSTDAASKTEDSIATEFGKLIGQNLKMQMSQDPRAVNEIDKEELLRGIETVLNSDTTKRGKSFVNGLAVAMQMIYPGIAQMEGQGLNIDRKALINELKKNFKSKDSVSMENLQNLQMGLQGMMQRAAKAKGDKNVNEGKKYLEEQMKKDKGFKKTASGIAYKVLKQGAGENFNDSATVDVVYVGKHIDGKEFDNSQGKPVPFSLKMTVPGFREIISMMKPGGKVLAIIPGELAYGEQGNPQGGIGPFETLVFEITAMGEHKEDPAAMPGRPMPAPAPKPAPVKK
jgi:FKBP-type peptidyl-prolyl cis-trans isomerase